MLNIGDKVKFLNDVGGGIVVGFQSKNVVVVENEDGFELPVLVSEVVKSNDSSYEATSKREKPQKIVEQVVEKESKRPVEIIEGNDDPRFYLAFYPADQVNPVSGEIKVYLINDSNFTLLYQYAHLKDGEYETIETGELEPNTKTNLDGLSQSDLNSLPDFVFRIIPVASKAKSLAEMVTKKITVNALKFYKEKSFKDSDFFDGKAMVFDLVTNPLKEEVDKLSDSDFKKVVNEKDKANRKTDKKVSKPKPEIVEIDLHIEELIDSTAGLSNHEILEIQLERFESELKLAIENKTKRIVFIHGVGNGVLKQAIYKKLKSSYARFNYQDASFAEYGYGATMIILRRK